MAQIKARSRQIASTFVRSFVFGVEDSLVSTVGLLSGIAIAGMSRASIFITGIVLIFVEAISMAAGMFLSDASAETYARGREAPLGRAIASAAIMFFSYFVSGFIPLLPYSLLPVSAAFWVSIGFSLVSLFILGVIGAKLSRINWVRNGLRMCIIGGLAIAVGVVVGKFTGRG